MNRYDAHELLYKAIPQVHRDHMLRWDHGATSLLFTPDEAREFKKCLARMARLDKSDDVPYTEVMELMRLHAGIEYRTPIADGYMRKIRALMARGIDLADFERVFKFKHQQYVDDAEWLPKVCNPDTLLTRFDKYLSEAGTSKIEPKPVPHRRGDN